MDLMASCDNDCSGASGLRPRLRWACIIPFGAVPFPPRCQLATDNKSTVMPCNWLDNDHFDTSIGPDSSASPASDTAAENAPLTGKARNKTPNRRQVNA